MHVREPTKKVGVFVDEKAFENYFYDQLLFCFTEDLIMFFSPGTNDDSRSAPSVLTAVRYRW